MARGAGYAALLGALLIGVAVVIGIVLLQIGDGTNIERHRPVGVTNRIAKGLLSHVVAINAGPIATCARTTAGTFCWGFNLGGQFGNGNAFSTNRPVPASP